MLNNNKEEIVLDPNSYFPVGNQGAHSQGPVTGPVTGFLLPYTVPAPVIRTKGYVSQITPPTLTARSEYL